MRRSGEQRLYADDAANLTAIANYPPQPKWISLGPAKMPTSRYGAAMAFDAGRAETVLFSGGSQQNGQPGNETWIWDGTNWSQRSPAVSPRRDPWRRWPMTQLAAR